MTVAEGSVCRHEDSLYGRCAACGMTWEEQAAEAKRVRAILELWAMARGADAPAGIAPCEPEEHVWTDAGGGMLICALCEAERWSDDYGI